PVVVSHAVLGHRNRVVLQGDLTPVVRHWNSSRVEGATIVRLLRERHVVLPQLVWTRHWVRLGLLVPKAQLSVSTEQVGAEHTLVIGKALHERHAEEMLDGRPRTIACGKRDSRSPGCAGMG